MQIRQNITKTVDMTEKVTGLEIVMLCSCISKAAVILMFSPSFNPFVLCRNVVKSQISCRLSTSSVIDMLTLSCTLPSIGKRLNPHCKNT